MSDLMHIGTLEASLRGVAQRFPGIALASSLSAEDMVLTDVIARHKLPIAIFTLDTGRLHAETLALIPAIKERYGLSLEVFRPDQYKVAEYVATQGLNAFYDSVEARRACCGIRKVEPLSRALAGRSAWMTGQRRSQSVTRTDLAFEEFDASHGLPKFNPLVDWSEADVWTYLKSFDVPVNALHAKGYPSIGCEPCTRAVKPGEDPRAGRWWWEDADKKECGLHIPIHAVAA
jgi:phosphoadenosine phosphosulfate reductase